MPFAELNKRLQNKLDVKSKIFALIYDNVSDEKFVKDPVTGKLKIAPKYMDGIKEFNEIKKLVSSSSDRSG